MRYLSLLLSLLVTSTFAQTHSELATQQYLNKIKNNPTQLTTFLQQMPKGGDLHNHLGGASYAENMISYGKNDSFCIDPNTYSLSINTTCPQNNTLNAATHSPDFTNRIIDAWSMRHFQPGKETGHDHFFATFGKYFLLANKYSADILSEVAERAIQQNESYLELMVTPDNNASGIFAKQFAWNPDLITMRNTLLKNGLIDVIQSVSKNLDNDEAKLPPSARNIKIRYLYQILREQEPVQVFAQLLTGFEVATRDHRVLGINMVQPEDGVISMRDYQLHMRMVNFLHQLYPQVRITLHAGELSPALVSPDGLRSHIHDAVKIAHASRIGHGVDIAYEDNYKNLLNVMAKNHVMVEINLVSNAAILNVTGKNHPILLYMKYNVPVALSTDDEGVLRSNLTEQYIKAVQDYDFDYNTLKNLVRNSITYSFIPGKSLWHDDQYKQINSACENKQSSRCQKFLNDNEKAKLQWDLEKRFLIFEKSIK